MFPVFIVLREEGVKSMLPSLFVVGVFAVSFLLADRVDSYIDSREVLDKMYS